MEPPKPAGCPPRGVFTTLRAALLADALAPSALLARHHARLRLAARDCLAASLPPPLASAANFAAFVGAKCREARAEGPAVFRVRVEVGGPARDGVLQTLRCDVVAAPQLLAVCEQLPRRGWSSPVGTLRVRLDPAASCTAGVEVRYKTTERGVYDAARRRVGEAVDDVLLWNERGEVTEASIANFAVEREEGVWVTPPQSCGLLAGVMREQLLEGSSDAEAEGGVLKEEVVSVAELKRLVLGEGRRLIGFNALRGVFAMELVEG
ncbi:hypothetical protein AB1Y20_011822 [Prymnesium parvum]|uniref:Uncharacterized protein n=1 Tax=Prymnesium parvum TaxID=97485 RepID=A0AB34II43_PRYPA